MWTVFDIETVSHDCVTDFIQKPNLDLITAAKNLKDPVKIAESIETRKQEAIAEHLTALSRAALDWNLSRIVAIGWQTDQMDEPICVVCQNEAFEAVALATFWGDAKRRQLVGFNARGFDVPTLIQRSRLLNVPFPKVSLNRYGRGDVTDIRDVLTFDDARYEAVMPRSLKAFCKRFGIENQDETSGADIAAMVAAGDWQGVTDHCLSDVRLTVRLAQRIGVLHVQSYSNEPLPVGTHF